MRNLAFAVIILSFLAGAFLASLDPKTISWNIYVPVLAAGAVAVFLLKSHDKKTAMSEGVIAANLAVIETSIDNIMYNIQQMDLTKDALPTYEARFEIDRKFRDDLFNFAEARMSIGHRYGLQPYADVMSAFAAGERYLNRVWSASADGYVDEVITYITKAHHQFKEAHEKLMTVMKG